VREEARPRAPDQVTTTLPHIPLQTPLDSVEWMVHRNLNVPVLLKVKLVRSPALMVVFLDQFEL
jgi:hypothetical protein